MGYKLAAFLRLAFLGHGRSCHSVGPQKNAVLVSVQVHDHRHVLPGPGDRVYASLELAFRGIPVKEN